MSVQLLKSRAELITLALVKEKEEGGKISTQYSNLSMTSELFEGEEETKMAGLLNISRTI